MWMLSEVSFQKVNFSQHEIVEYTENFSPWQMTFGLPTWKKPFISKLNASGYLSDKYHISKLNALMQA